MAAIDDVSDGASIRSDLSAMTSQIAPWSELRDPLASMDWLTCDIFAARPDANCVRGADENWRV